MQSFADQSAVAIENARLFEEIAQKTSMTSSIPGTISCPRQPSLA
jgi:hypothetical protein